MFFNACLGTSGVYKQLANVDIKRRAAEGCQSHVETQNRHSKSATRNSDNINPNVFASVATNGKYLLPYC